MWYLNLKIALRNILKNISFSLINIGGLAVGLTCCLLLLLYANYDWSYDKQFKGIDRIYNAKLNIKLAGGIVTYPTTPNKLAGAALQNLPGIAAASRVQGSDKSILFSHGVNKFRLNNFYVDPSFLKIFDYQFIQGNAETALIEPNGILITEITAKKLFGGENPIGQSIKWDNRKQLKVTAVIADLPKNQSLQFDVLQTWAFYDSENPNDRNNAWSTISCNTYFKLKDNAAFGVTDAALRKLIAANDKGTIMEAFLFPYSKYHLYNSFENGKQTGGRIDILKLFIFLALSVLLIASINYMNLSTARSEKRAKEVGVRKALGSPRSTLMGQFFLESLLLSFMAMVLAFALVELTLPYFDSLLDITIHIDYKSSLFWITLLSIILLTGTLSGIYPAFYLSSFTPVKVLKGFTGIGKSSLPVRKILVVFQFTLSVSMIICAIVIYSQIQYMKNKPLGFDQDNLVELDRDGELLEQAKLEVLKAQLLQAGAITSATEYIGGFTDRGGYVTGNISWPGKSAIENFSMDYRSIGFNFTKTVGAKIIMGRDLSTQFATDSSAAVLLNQEAVKMMGLKNPVGKKIAWGQKQFIITGIIQNYNNASIGNKPQPALFYYGGGESRSVMLRLNPAQSLSTSIQEIRNICQQLNPAYPVELQFVNKGMEQKLKDEKLLGVLSQLFGSFAILISCIGLLGLALYMAEQRKKEISIRKVLGADLQSILILLNKDFIRLVVISNVIAFPIAYILAVSWLSKYDYKVDLAVWPFLTAASVSLIIALVTVSVQSIKVAKSDPVKSLKYE